MKVLDSSNSMDAKHWSNYGIVMASHITHFCLISIRPLYILYFEIEDWGGEVGGHCLCRYCLLQYSVWNFNLANNVWTLSSRFWYFTCVFILTQPFQGFQHFDFVTSTSEFGLLIENFGLVHKFSTVIARALIFHTSLYFDMIFLLVSRYVSLWLDNLWYWQLLAGFAFPKHILLYEYIYWLIGSNT